MSSSNSGIFSGILTRYTYRKHVFNDLRPYACTFASCKGFKLPFKRRHEWFQHENRLHRRFWVCIEGCQSRFQSEADFEAHIKHSHPSFSAPDQLRQLTAMCERQMPNDDRVECILCRQKGILLRDLEKHLGQHQEQLALFALPSTDENEPRDEADSQTHAADSLPDQEEPTRSLDASDAPSQASQTDSLQVPTYEHIRTADPTSGIEYSAESLPQSSEINPETSMTMLQLGKTEQEAQQEPSDQAFVADDSNTENIRTQDRGSAPENESPEQRVQRHLRKIQEYERGVGPDALETLKENRDLGMAYRDQGKLPEAEVFCKRAAEGMEKTLGPNSDETLHSLESLSMVRTSLGDFENGLGMLNQVVEGYEKRFGAEGKPTLTALKRQSVNFSGLGNNSEAAKLLNRILKGYEKTYGPDHPETMDVVKRLARTSRALGKSSEVEPLLERALQHYDHASDLAGPEYVSILNESARCYKSQNRLDEAEAISQRMLGVSEKKYGAQDIRTLTALLIRGRIHVQQGRLSEAEEALQRVIDSLDMNGQSGQYTDEFGPDSYTIEGGALELLSVIYGEQGKALESEIMMERALKTVSNFNDVWRRKSWGKHLTGILFNMYTEHGKVVEAEKIKAQAFTQFGHVIQDNGRQTESNSET